MRGSALAHRRRGIAFRFARFRAAGAGAFTAFLAVLGPGLLAGLSDDDPAGITTYSILGTDHGYRLLRIIPAAGSPSRQHWAPRSRPGGWRSSSPTPWTARPLGAGLLGAALLAAAIVPLATAYSIAEGVGAPASLDLDSHRFQLFYAVFVGLTVAAVSVVSLPPHVIVLQVLASDPAIKGEARSRWGLLASGWVGVVLILACVGALAWSWVGALVPA